MAYDGISEFDWRSAICLGLGMSQEATGEYMNCARQTIANHITKNTKFFDQIVLEVQTLRAKNTTKAELATAVGAQERIKAVFDRALTITERLIEKAESLGDDLTLAEAMDIHKNLTQWAAKFVASEAPKRLQVESEHVEVHKIDDQTLMRLEAFMERHQQYLPPADVKEAEVLTQ